MSRHGTARLKPCRSWIWNHSHDWDKRTTEYGSMVGTSCTIYFFSLSWSKSNFCSDHGTTNGTVSDRTSKLRLGDPGDGDWTWNRWVSQWIDCATRPVRPWHQCTWAELLLVSQVKLTQLKDPCQLLSCKFLTLCMVVSTNTIKYIYHLHILYIILYYNLPVQTALPCALTEDFPVLSCQQLFGTGSFPGMAKAQRPSSQGHECCNQHSCRFLGIAQATNDMFGSNFGTQLSEGKN